MKYNLFLIATTAVVLSACSDNDSILSAVDTKTWELTQNMDSTTKAGDDFFMYCNGGWYKRTAVPTADGNEEDGLNMESFRKSLVRQQSLDYPAITKLLSDTADIDKTTAAALPLIAQNVAAFENITTQREAWQAIGRALQMGYTTPLQIQVYNTDEKKVYFFVTRPDEMESLILTAMGISDSRVLKRLLPQNTAAERSEKSTVITKAVPLKSKISQSASDMLKVIVESMGITDMVYIDTSANDYMTWLASLTPAQVKALLQTRAQLDAIYTSHQTITDLNAKFNSNFTLYGLISYTQYAYMGYIYSYAYSKKYVTEAMLTKCNDMCEDIRSAFSERIASLDWMSAATKAKAQEKLAAIKFNVLPSSWYSEGLPELKGASLLEDVITLRQAAFALKKKMMGMETKENFVSINLTDPNFDFVDFAYKKSNALNAYYVRFLNQVEILPNFMLPPAYDESASDAKLYGILGWIIGHEITHGFDSEGAKYNKEGTRENWWTAEDSLKYVAKQQQLIDCYNHLLVYPDIEDSLYVNGTQTLDENIADLGGIETTLDAYTKKLIREGYSGEELQKQQRKYYQAMTEYLRRKFTKNGYETLFTNETHTADNARVNGIVQNSDRWYDLFGVKPGDKLYLAPGKRTTIW